MAAPGALAEEPACDAILVGGGVGSLAAALRLRERGLLPLVIERSAAIGGASAYSGGVVWAPGNHRMRAKGLPDSTEEAMTYLASVARGRWDPDLARAYVETIGWVLEWLEETTPLHWMSYPDLPDYFAERPGGKLAGRCLLPQPRVAAEALERAAARQPELARVRESVHFPAERRGWAAGRALAGCLWSRALELDVPYMLEARVVKLLREEDGVTAVEVETPDGPRTVRSRLGVLLNTGGFEWNAEMSRNCVPGQPVHPQTPPAGEGDGHVMGTELGAALALMDQTISTPAICVPGEENEGRPLYRLLFQELAFPHSLIVNRAGRRFANETFFQDIARGWDECEEASGEAANLPMHFVFDERYRREFGLPGAVEVGEYLSAHPDLESLALARGIDPRGLAAQVERMNADAVRGVDEQFGRGASAYQRFFAAERRLAVNPTIGALEEPPFYAVELFPATSGHRGGLLIDPAGRVLDVRGRTIRGLYACGSVAAGLITGETYLTGASVGGAIAFAVLAADAMAAEAAPEPHYAASAGPSGTEPGEET